MIHVGIDLEFTDHNCTQIMVEMNHFFYFQGCGCGFKPKINQWISLTRKVDGDVIYYVYSWLHQDQFLVSKILTGHVTNFITPPIVIIYHGALLLQVSTSYHVKILRFGRWRGRWVWCTPPSCLKCTKSQSQLTESFKTCSVPKIWLGKRKKLLYIDRDFFIPQ